MRRHTRWAIGTISMAALFTAPGVALATFPGENGRIVFVSGRGGAPGDDSGADVYVAASPGGSESIVASEPGQHRHPAWSPDLKKVAYANWASPKDNQKIWVLGLTAEGPATPQRLGIHSSTVRDDRPAWSPDGTKIAYESEVTDGSGQMDILIADVSQTYSGAPTINLTNTPGFIEGKPIWSPDGKWIYYSRRPMPPNFDDDILRERSDDSSSFPSFVVNSATAEYQAALSPDGSRLCYTRGAFASADADVYTVDLGSFADPVNLSDTTAGAYNCDWSPDGRWITYVRGTFTGGALVYERSNNSSSGALSLTTDIPNHFDGNPDWAPLHPAICDGKAARIVGTDDRDTLIGTSARNVFSAFAASDTIKGGEGNDLACAGGGNDTVNGGPGNDVLFGGGGKDTFNGGPGNDTCVGGPGADVFRNCETRIQSAIAPDAAIGSPSRAMAGVESGRRRR